MSAISPKQPSSGLDLLAGAITKKYEAPQTPLSTTKTNTLANQRFFSPINPHPHPNLDGRVKSADQPPSLPTSSSSIDVMANYSCELLNPSMAKKRALSKQQKTTLDSLVEKHGEDYETILRQMQFLIPTLTSDELKHYINQSKSPTHKDNKWTPERVNRLVSLYQEHQSYDLVHRHIKEAFPDFDVTKAQVYYKLHYLAGDHTTNSPPWAKSQEIICELDKLLKKHSMDYETIFSSMQPLIADLELSELKSYVENRYTTCPISNAIIKNNESWTPEESAQLITAIKNYPHDFSTILTIMQEKKPLLTIDQLDNQINALIKKKLIDRTMIKRPFYNWSEEEHKKLRELHELHGTDYRTITCLMRTVFPDNQYTQKLISDRIYKIKTTNPCKEQPSQGKKHQAKSLSDRLANYKPIPNPQEDNTRKFEHINWSKSDIAHLNQLVQEHLTDYETIFHLMQPIKPELTRDELEAYIKLHYKICSVTKTVSKRYERWNTEMKNKLIDTIKEHPNDYSAIFAIMKNYDPFIDMDRLKNQVSELIKKGLIDRSLTTQKESAWSKEKHNKLVEFLDLYPEATNITLTALMNQAFPGSAFSIKMIAEFMRKKTSA